ncbi:hypothetical protein J14TS2_01480 [Bacillus sp. J14TS2]|uniref:hypothetical protein n=1 Tax=Bacillus sp. J14TS2 TaxID=2807188 RepID=UPI001B0EDA6F|nr:hypothetical protein [Bacillus sp. J14TS2]GIN69673.1 hypothetical protein J14TS2_01480 [Bacillus sp. J14TS2]
MSMNIEIRRIMSHGKIAGRGYQLVCHGCVAKNSNIILSPVNYFSEPSSLQNSKNSFLDTTILLSATLFVHTVLDVTVKKEEMEWNIRMVMDLNNWLFYIEDQGEDTFIPNEVKVLLFSSFSIQFQRKALTLGVLASKKHIMSKKHYSS